MRRSYRRLARLPTLDPRDSRDPLHPPPSPSPTPLDPPPPSRAVHHRDNGDGAQHTERTIERRKFAVEFENLSSGIDKALTTPPPLLPLLLPGSWLRVTRARSVSLVGCIPSTVKSTNQKKRPRRWSMEKNVCRGIFLFTSFSLRFILPS